MKKILFVDDSLTLRMIAKQVFVSPMYQLTLSASDLQALSIYQKERFDLVILDAGLIGGEFSNTLGCLSEPVSQGQQQTKVIVLSSLFHPYEPDLQQPTAVCAVVKKPFEVAPMLELVDALLQPGPQKQFLLHGGSSLSVGNQVEPEEVSVDVQEPIHGIPAHTPLMPRLPFLPRAPLSAPVFAALTELAQKGKAYEAIAQLSAETIASIAWEVVPTLARAMLQQELSNRDVETKVLTSKEQIK